VEETGNRPAPEREPLVLKSNAPLETFLAQHIFMSFMWAVAGYINAEALGPTDILGIERLLDQDFAKAFRVPRLQNNLLADIARGCEVAGLGSSEELLHIMISPLSQVGMLASGKMRDLVDRVIQKQEKLDAVLERLEKMDT
jgi:hypothetical protein